MREFIFFNGIEKEMGNFYICTPKINTLERDVNIIFQKTYEKLNDERIYIPELIMEEINPQSVSKAILSYINQNHKYDFFLVRDKLGIEILQAQTITTGYKLTPQKILVIDKDKLFENDQALEKKIKQYLI